MNDAAIAAAYDARSSEYIQVAGTIEQMDAADIGHIGAWRSSTPGRLLDAGCGPGLWTAFLADAGSDTIGVDIAAAFLDAARTSHPQCTFVHASVSDLPFDDAAFDGILAWYSLIHTSPADLPGALAELARVLRPGGSLLIGYFEGDPGEPFAHAVTTAWFWDAETLTALLERAGLSVRSQERRDRVAGEISRRPHGSLTAVRRS